MGAQGFGVFHDRISTPGDGIIIFNGMRDHTAESIKSLEGYKRAWGEEAQTLSHRSLELLRPTIRAAGSELWWSWNPRRKADPIDMLLRGDTLPKRSIVVQSNWRDNPWFPSVLEEERVHGEETSPETYEHIWEGDYVGVAKGAYYAKHLTEAKKRITRLTPDPLMEFQAFWDIGGTGQNYSDACSIIIRQVIGQTINVLDHYTTVGQPLGAHLGWLRDNGYGSAKCILPHDGRKADGITIKRYEDHIREAGFEVDVVKNQGAGAAMKRIEAVRRVFPRIWFNNAPVRDVEDATEALRASLGWYHEKIDEHRQIGMGPDHDWSSHDADAFGLMAGYGDRLPVILRPLRFKSDMP
jgi:phage terminase large subunit